MKIRFFIARRLSHKSPIVTAAIAVSFLVVIIAVAVSSGFRHELRTGLSEMTGDVQLMMSDMSYVDESSPVQMHQSYMDDIEVMPSVSSIDPVVYRAGIVRHSEEIYGVMIKGVEGGVTRFAGMPLPDTTALAVSIPSTLAQLHEMKSLVDTLFMCDNPTCCPHGRPTIIHFSKYDIEKMFKRSGI